MLDVAGQDATEAFEDVGHSDEAREVLDGLLVGELKRLVSDRTLYLDGTTANMCHYSLVTRAPSAKSPTRTREAARLIPPAPA